MTDITEAELSKLYLEDGLSETKIGLLYGLSQRQVSLRRMKYQIQTIQKSDRLKLPPLTQLQKALLLGSILGDAGLTSRSDCTASLCEYHSDQQYGYISWKAGLWGDHLCSVKPVKSVKNGLTYTGSRLTLHSSRELYPYWVQAYPDRSGNKSFSKLDLSEFDAFSLAIWFLDDGSKTSNGYVRFSVSPRPEDQQIQLKLLRRFGLVPVIYSIPDADIWLHDRESLTRFLDLVGPYVPASMGYKLELVPRARGLSSIEVLRDQLGEYVEQGRSIEWISQATGSSVDTIRRLVKKEGLVIDTSKYVPTWEEAKGIIASGLQGEPLVELLTSLKLPKPPSDDEIVKDFNNLRHRTLAKVSDGVIEGGGRVGLAVCQAAFPYRFEATNGQQPSLTRAWFNPVLIRRAVEFQLKVGDPLYPMNVFRALRAIVRTPSNFRPAIAKRLVEDFTPVGGLVLDPCAGYGGRAVGTLAAGRRYIGVDPHPKAGEAFQKLQDLLKVNLTFFNQPIEEVDFGDLQADLVITSPPYFSVERYSNDPSQSWVRYPTWDLWLSRFLSVLLAKSFNSLVPGGRLLLNVADIQIEGFQLPLVSESIRLAELCGFVHEGTLEMKLGSFGSRHRMEPILVFLKGGGVCSVPCYPLPKGPDKKETCDTKVSGLTEAALRELYEVELLTDAEIGKRFGTSDVLISQQRKRWGISTISFTQRSAKASGSLSLDSLTKETLADLYLHNSDDQIAKMYSVSKVAIRKLRHRLGIETISKTTRALTGCYRRI
jgi:hypothetical protein